MTRPTNARLAGFTFLFYIAAGISSLMLVLLTQRAGLFAGAVNFATSITWLVWLPMLVFELAFALWLIVKGVNAPVREMPHNHA